MTCSVPAVRLAPQACARQTVHSSSMLLAAAAVERAALSTWECRPLHCMQGASVDPIAFYHDLKELDPPASYADALVDTFW